MHQVVSCPFCKSIHVDKGKFTKFNHLKHKHSHCGLFFSSAMPCVGVKPVVPKPAVKLVTKTAALSNVVPIHDVTCPANVVESDATGCNVHSKPMAALECHHMCEVAESADVAGTKTATEYSADHPAETLGVAGSSLLCSGSDLTEPPLVMLHL